MNEQLSLSHVKTGILKQPRRTLIYGVQGIGKSLFCASAPDVIFISTEDGLGDIDCAQFPLAKSFADVKNAIRVLCKEDHKYKALAVDSMDWLERLIWDHVIDNSTARVILNTLRTSDTRLATRLPFDTGRSSSRASIGCVTIKGCKYF